MAYPVSFLCLSALALLIVACSQETHETPGAQTEENSIQQAQHNDHEKDSPGTSQVSISPEALQGQAFDTAVVERLVLKDEIRATATIQPNEYKLTHISPRIEGKAVKVMAELGDHVTQGQVLAIMDSIELGQKKSEYLQARVNLNIARQNFEREERLYRQRISSEVEYLNAKGEYERSLAAARAAYEALRLVGLREEDIKKITWSQRGQPLSYFPLVAPYAGIAIQRHITPGELITPRDKPFTIADLSTVWIILDIYEEDLAKIQVGSEVRITVDAFPGETFLGTVVYLSNLVKPDTRTVEARVEIANPDLRLRPGMFARAAFSVPATERKTVLALPEDAVQEVDGRKVVFVEQASGRYAVHEVALGKRFDSYVEIVSGLQENQKVVTKGSFYLKSVLLRERMGGHAH